MSVLIKRTDSSSGGGSSKGYPPGNVTNVTIKGGYKKVTIKWTDPDDAVVGDKTLSTWQSTTLVRKKGSIPTSIKDGDTVLETTEKNKYKNTEYTDNNLEIDTYYYRFFVCNTDKIYNNDSSMIYSAAVVEANPILKNNTWEVINKISELGIASSIWNIGDEIDITLSEVNKIDYINDYDTNWNNEYINTYISAQTVTLQIWDFNHFDKSDGSGKAGIVFGMKNLMKDTNYRYNHVSTTQKCWTNCTFKDYVIPRIIESLPEDVKSVIKTVNTYANIASQSESDGKLSTDTVFLPGYTELGLTTNSTIVNSHKKQSQFPIFSNDESRKKKSSNGEGSYNQYLTRSTSPFWSGNFGECMMVTDAGAGKSYYVHVEEGVCFCFCV